jgi:glycosyltransferase involved in cell wall biosynthesis
MEILDQRKPRVLQVAVDCVEGKGGIFKAVRSFQHVLGGVVLSFTEQELIPQSSTTSILHVPITGGLIARRYGMPHPELLRRCVEEHIQGIKLVVVHGMYRYHAQWAARFARAAAIPYWVVPHGALDPWVFSYRSIQKRIWMQWIGSRILREAKSVIVTTAREAEKAARYLAGCSVRVVHLPVQRATIGGREEARLSVREQLGISNNARILLFLGRLHPMKRVIETIDAVHKAHQPDVHLVVVGPGSPELSVEDCRTHVRKLKTKRIHIVGPHFGTAKDRWLLSADGFISLSHRENFNYSAAEALCCGLPVILSPGNDLASELSSFSAGWLVDSYGLDEEADAIRQFGSSTAGELAAMGTAGARWASTNLTDFAFVSALRQLERATLANDRER